MRVLRLSGWVGGRTARTSRTYRAHIQCTVSSHVSAFTARKQASTGEQGLWRAEGTEQAEVGKTAHDRCTHIHIHTWKGWSRGVLSARGATCDTALRLDTSHWAADTL